MNNPNGIAPRRWGEWRAQREFARLMRPPKDRDRGGATDSLPALVNRRDVLLQRLQWLRPAGGPPMREELAYLATLIDLINAELAAMKAADVTYWGSPPDHRARLLKFAQEAVGQLEPEDLPPIAAQLRELGEDFAADALVLIGPAR